MAVAGHIVAYLTANTTGWSGGLRAGLGQLAGFSNQVSRFAAGAAKGFADFGSQLDDMAQRTGVSAASLSSLSFVANQTSTSMESLQMGFVKMSQFMAQVNAGSKEATETLRMLGLTAEQLRGLPPDQQLLVFADAINKLKTTSDQGVAAMKVFGKGAVDLLPLLNSGSAGIVAMQAEAKRLGLTMSNDATKSAALFGDTLDKLKLSIVGVVNKVGAALTPTLQVITDELLSLVKGTSHWGEMLAGLAIGIGAVVVAIKLWTIAAEAAAIAQTILLFATGGPKAWVTIAVGLGLATAATIALTSAAKERAAQNKLAEADAKRATQFIEREGAAAEQAAAQVAVFSDRMKELKSLHDALLPKSQQVAQAVHQMGLDWLAAAQAGEPLTLTFEQLRELQAGTILRESGFASAFESIIGELQVLRGEITETEQAFQQMAMFGVDSESINQLRQLTAERDRLLTEQKAKEAAAAKESARLADIKGRVKAGNETPLGAFQAELKEVKHAIAAGVISGDAGREYLLKKRRELIDAQPEPASVRGQASNVSLNARSQQANQLIVDLANRRGPKNGPEALAKEQTKLARDSAALLTQIRDDARRNQIAAKPFGRGGRS